MDENRDHGLEWLTGGAVAALIRARDWSATPLGPAESWPVALKAGLATIQGAPIATVIMWGPDLIQLYNDAYGRLAGAKHPVGLGMPTSACWPETWDQLSPVYDAVWRGECRHFAGKHLAISRNGAPEDAWFDLSFSPFRDEHGIIRGVLVVVVEVTDRVRGAEALAESRHQVQVERGFLATLVEQAPVGISIAEANSGEAVLLNRRAVELLGHEQPRTSIDRYRYYRAVHPDGRPYAIEEYPTVRSLTTGERVDEDMDYRRPDGSLVILHVSSAPVRDPASGEILASVTVFHDITGQRKATERQNLLLHELNHRVKNTLTTIQSIAQQTARSAATPEAFVKDFGNRVLALSATHELLTASQWRGTSLRRLLEAELVPYRGSSDGARISLDGPPVHLGSGAVLSLGLAFHELATNAAKYGALSVPEGRVAVRWHWPNGAPDGMTEAAGTETPLSIEWEESGGPPVAMPTRRGFGSRLIERGLAHDLGGRATLDFRPEGLRCVITFPVTPETMGEQP